MQNYSAELQCNYPILVKRRALNATQHEVQSMHISLTSAFLRHNFELNFDLLEKEKKKKNEWKIGKWS